jgi:hypothetical protein
LWQLEGCGYQHLSPSASCEQCKCSKIVKITIRHQYHRVCSARIKRRRNVCTTSTVSLTSLRLPDLQASHTSPLRLISMIATKLHTCLKKHTCLKLSRHCPRHVARASTSTVSWQSLEDAVNEVRAAPPSMVRHHLCIFTHYISRVGVTCAITCQPSA